MQFLIGESESAPGAVVDSAAKSGLSGQLTQSDERESGQYSRTLLIDAGIWFELVKRFHVASCRDARTVVFFNGEDHVLEDVHVPVLF